MAQNNLASFLSGNPSNSTLGLNDQYQNGLDSTSLHTSLIQMTNTTPISAQAQGVHQLLAQQRSNPTCNNNNHNINDGIGTQQGNANMSMIQQLMNNQQYQLQQLTSQTSSISQNTSSVNNVLQQML